MVKTEYIAEDGQIFTSEEECKKYEMSELFMINKQLKRMTDKKITSYDINDRLLEDETVEIFEIKTEKDLENLRRYLYLQGIKNGMSEDYIKSCFTSENEKRSDFVFDNVTFGHEVMIFWTCDKDWFWVYRDGSINGYCEYFRDRITNLIIPESKE